MSAMHGGRCLDDSQKAGRVKQVAWQACVVG